MENVIYAYKISVGKLEEENNIIMDVKEIVFEGLVWIHMMENRDQWPDLLKKVAKLRDQS
jgi:hypothetical protein